MLIVMWFFMWLFIILPFLIITGINNIYFESDYIPKEFQKYVFQSLYLCLIISFFLERIIKLTSPSIYISIFFAISILMINLISNDEFSLIITQFIYKSTGSLIILFCIVFFMFFYISQDYKWIMGGIVFQEMVYIVSFLFFIYEGYNLIDIINNEIHCIIYDKPINYNDYLLPKINKSNRVWFIILTFSFIFTIIMPYFFDLQKNLKSIYHQRKLPSELTDIIINFHNYNITNELMITLLFIVVLIYISMLYSIKMGCYWLQKLEEHTNSTISIFSCIIILTLLEFLFFYTELLADYWFIFSN